MSSNIVGVNSADHAESVIKSLRSLSLSNKRYQRAVEADGGLFQNINSFDTVVSTQGKETAKKQAIDAKISQVPIHSNSLQQSSLSSDDESPRQTSTSKFACARASYDSDSDSDEDDDVSSNSFRKKLQAKIDAGASLEASRVLVSEKKGSTRGARADSPDDMSGDDEDDRELFEGFVAPRTRPEESTSRSRQGGSLKATTGSRDFDKTKAAGKSSSHSSDFSSSRVIVKPGQRIVVKPRSRKATEA